MPLKAGTQIYAKKTAANTTRGIQPGDQGWITHVTGAGPKPVDRVSFYLERRGRPGSWVEAVCDAAVFGQHFIEASDWRLAGLSVGQLADAGQGAAHNPAYVHSKHFDKPFPDRIR